MLYHNTFRGFLVDQHQYCNTFSAGHKIEDVRVETRKYQFLYAEADMYRFMNKEDYKKANE